MSQKNTHKMFLHYESQLKFTVIVPRDINTE